MAKEQQHSSTPAAATQRKTNCIAHRGASGRSPENTLLAFRYAFELGADAIECDVQLSADGAPVIIHDASVDRTTNGRGLVEQLTLEELRQLDAGAGEQIPTLQEVLDLCQAAGKQINLELKGETLEQTYRVGQVVGELLESGGYQDMVLISSFWLPAITRFKNEHPQFRIGTLHSGTRWRFTNMLTFARAAGADALHPNVRLTTRALVEAAHAAGLQVNVWTVDQSSAIARLASWGVDGIMSNYPDKVRAALGQQ